MSRITSLASVTLLAALPLALAACATPTTAFDRSRPVRPIASTPVLLHDMAIANPPYPLPRYASYLDEPTRFEFRPRPPILQVQDNNADEGGDDYTVAADGSYLENGILYVDPNQ